MPWNCRLLDTAPARADRRVGDMWIEDDPWTKLAFTSDEYRTKWMGIRGPIFVVIPGLLLWCPDRVNSAGVWVVSGALPHITVQGEVDLAGYRGTLADGVLSDDFYGRVYDENGGLI